jgi:nucleotide-binding universal stress UspA family protein
MAGPGIRVLVTNSPLSGADALIAESESATLLVLQRRNVGKLNRIYSGSTTSGLAARARCPVVVVRADHSGPAGSTPGGVVVGVDGSGRSGGAIREAWFEASARSAKLIAVHAWDVLAGGAPYYGHVAPTEQEIAAARASAELLLSEALAGLAEEYPDVAVQRVLRRGPAVDGLVEAAAGAELLVISRHRDSAIERIALGSKAQQLLDRAPCPVLIAAPDSAGNLRGP